MSISLNPVVFFGMEASKTHERLTPGAVRALSETAIVARAQTGDPAAFEELVRRFRNDVYGLAYHFLRNREEAWDASQEVFIKVHRSLKRFRGDASIRTWLLRITANHCKDQLKKRRFNTVNLDDAGDTLATQSTDPTPGGRAEAEEIGKAIEEALDTLSPKHRMAFVLREFEGMSYQEMAEVMNCTMGTVMSRLHHARKKLQRVLLRKGVVEDSVHA